MLCKCTIIKQYMYMYMYMYCRICIMHKYAAPVGQWLLWPVYHLPTSAVTSQHLQNIRTTAWLSDYICNVNIHVQYMEIPNVCVYMYVRMYSTGQGKRQRVTCVPRVKLVNDDNSRVYIYAFTRKVKIVYRQGAFCLHGSRLYNVHVQTCTLYTVHVYMYMYIHVLTVYKLGYGQWLHCLYSIIVWSMCTSTSRPLESTCHLVHSYSISGTNSSESYGGCNGCVLAIMRW